MATYRVQNGDSPARIAAKMTGNSRRASELVAANPTVPRVVAANGQVTFRALRVGQSLSIPTSWNAFGWGGKQEAPPPKPIVPPTPGWPPGIGPTPVGPDNPVGPSPGGSYYESYLSGYFGIGDANSVQVEMQALTAAVGTQATADADGSFSGYVKGLQNQGQVAVSSGGLGPDLDSTYGIAVTGPSTQAAYNINGTLQAIPNGAAGSSNPALQAYATQAQGLLSQMLQDYQAALAAGQGAANQTTPPAGGSSGTGAGDLLSQYLASNGCDCSAQLQKLTKAFQASAGLAQDGYYGTGTQAALQKVLTSEWNASGNAGPAPAATAACYTTSGGKQTGQCTPGGKPPAPTSTKCPAGQVNDSVTGACVAPCSGGGAPASGSCAGLSTPTTVQAGNGPLIAGILLVVLGGGAVSYAVSKHKAVH